MSRPLLVRDFLISASVIASIQDDLIHPPLVQLSGEPLSEDTFEFKGGDRNFPGASSGQGARVRTM